MLYSRFHIWSAGNVAVYFKTEQSRKHTETLGTWVLTVGETRHKQGRVRVKEACGVRALLEVSV